MTSWMIVFSYPPATSIRLYTWNVLLSFIAHTSFGIRQQSYRRTGHQVCFVAKDFPFGSRTPISAPSPPPPLTKSRPKSDEDHVIRSSRAYIALKDNAISWQTVQENPWNCATVWPASRFEKGR
ncbi:hypothetical protein MPH_10200 [Macrophomina phaseolina MS6]|uniref:Uncharacterized protein n=1 Tax=Macrophomina phaseolina (strain MS6) TaxID=1126212 RepID=K2QRZ8_MACPH|nr:hypothetical protein MPH_10200 [Macrophomina phaseolina MS6]